MYKAMPGKVIVEILSDEGERESGLVVVKGKEKPLKGKVLSVGDPWHHYTGKVYKPNCRKGDVVHLRRGTPVGLEWHGNEGVKQGRKTMVYFEDIVAVEG